MSKFNREIRARASLERRSITDAEKAAGYIGAITGVIPFNSDSVQLTKRGRPKPFIEQISPEAFKRSISEDKDIMANAGHTDDPLAALGRIGENLTVTMDDKALRWDALVPNTKAAADMLELIDKRIIRGTSFEFEVRGQAGEKWEARDAQTDQRTILDARLLAFNPVTWPAYTDSSLTVELRRRERDQEGRGTYYSSDGIVDWYDPTITADIKYAVNALNREYYCLTDSLEFLRTNPSGPMADLAQEEAADSATDISFLVDWLSKNGATANPELMTRSIEKLAEARKISPTDSDRERRFRILQASSV